MKDLVSNGSVVFNGIKYSIPLKEDLKKWNYREWKDGRSNFREVWIDSYDITKTGFCMFSSCLVLKNGKIATLDDKRLKDEDLNKALAVFKLIDEEKSL